MHVKRHSCYQFSNLGLRNKKHFDDSQQTFSGASKDLNELLEKPTFKKDIRNAQTYIHTWHSVAWQPEYTSIFPFLDYKHAML